MTPVKRNGNLMRAFPTLFDDFLNRDLFNGGQSNYSNTGTSLPAVNIKETNEGFDVEMAAPGMKKTDFKVQLEGNMLTISSEKSSNTDENEGDRYSRKEFSYQSFERSFTLPKDVVDVEKINAKYEDGVLQLHIPKMEQAKQKAPKMIQIS
ncbi:Hsp20/alpha crystallin family protein [soil metagenome]